MSALSFKARLLGVIGDADKPTLLVHTQSTEIQIQMDWNMALLIAEEILARQTAMMKAKEVA
jgi:hypothetical protein